MAQIKDILAVKVELGMSFIHILHTLIPSLEEESGKKASTKPFFKVRDKRRLPAQAGMRDMFLSKQKHLGSLGGVPDETARRFGAVVQSTLARKLITRELGNKEQGTQRTKEHPSEWVQLESDRQHKF